ncbi:MAG: tripartite tricarboxylate transporter substrate binding protein [Sphingomonadaceae bacterium]
MSGKAVFSLVSILALAFLVGACAPGAPAPASTPASTPAATAAPAVPTKAPAATTAPPTVAPAAAPTKAAADAAGDFPNRPITILVAFTAGGSSDVGARIVADIMSRDLGQPVQVVNRGGAGGQIGWTELAKAKPDGYTIGGINLPHLPAIVVDQERKAVFQQGDLIPLATQAVDPTQIAVAANSPWKTLKDLVDDAKKRPKQITAGVVGILNDDEVGYLQASEVTGMDLRPVRFDGAADAIKALLGGHVNVTFCTVGDNFVQAKGGNIRVLAVMDKERTQKFFPDVPTMKELGYPEVLSSSTRGFAAPKGVPEPILKKLEDSLVKAMKTAEHITKIEEAGQPVVIVGRTEFTKMYNDSFATVQKWIDKRIKDQ